MPLNGRWAYHYEHCRKCGTTEIKHWSKGLCEKCFRVKRYSTKKYKRTQSKRMKMYYQKNKEKLLARMNVYWPKYINKMTNKFIANHPDDLAGTLAQIITQDEGTTQYRHRWFARQVIKQLMKMNTEEALKEMFKNYNSLLKHYFGIKHKIKLKN